MTCLHRRTTPVISAGGATIGILCDGCGTAVEVMCPYCRATFKDLDRHVTSASKCHEAFMKTKANRDAIDRLVGARKAARL